MNKKWIKVVVPVLIITEITFMFLSFKSFNSREIKEEKQIQKIDREQFSMYVENANGKYEKYSSNTFPIGYTLNNEKTTCVDYDGNQLDNIVSYSNDQLTISSNKTIFCELYFEILP